MEPLRVTAHPTAHEQLLYFTSPSLDEDGQHLIFISDRTGHPNVFARHLTSGQETALTDNHHGTLKSYVYFNGTPRQGLGKASLSFDPTRRILYFLQDDEIWSADLTGKRRRLGRIRADQVTAFTHVSADGLRLCVPTTDARALEAERFVQGGPAYTAGQEKKNEVISDKPDYDVDERVQREGLSSFLDVYDTATGALLAREPVPRAWVTHVQFSPVDHNQILYNHEWPGDCGIRRLWLWDGHQHTRLRTEGQGRTKADWTCHEMWQPDGQYIVYHGKYPDGVAFVGRVGLDGREPIEIRLDPSYHRYGHFTVANRHHALVSDGYYHPSGVPENENWGGEWISLVTVDWQAREIRWQPLCEHRSFWDCQDSHPHPVFDPRDGFVYFTSNREGARAVFRVPVPSP